MRHNITLNLFKSLEAAAKLSAIVHIKLVDLPVALLPHRGLNAAENRFFKVSFNGIRDQRRHGGELLGDSADHGCGQDALCRGLEMRNAPWLKTHIMLPPHLLDNIDPAIQVLARSFKETLNNCDIQERSDSCHTQNIII